LNVEARTVLETQHEPPAVLLRLINTKDRAPLREVSPMPKSFQIKLREQGTGLEIAVAGEIRQNDWEKLIFYADEVVRLEASSALSKDLHTQVKFRVTPGTKRLQFAGSTPPDEDVVVILHRLRPFILQKEPANFYQMTNILSRYLNNPKARQTLQYLKDVFSGKDFQRQIRLQIDWKSPSIRTVVNSEETLQTWLNAVEYHRDAEKRQQIEELRKVFPDPALYALFVSMLLDKIKAIINVAVIIRTIERNNGVALGVP